MLTKTLLTHDSIQLTYYIFNPDKTQSIVIFNAPGMSVKFWVPIINQIGSQYRIIYIEYRGFPGKETILTPDQYRFDYIVNDFASILRQENVQTFSAFSWCLGAKVMMSLQATNEFNIQSMHALNMAYKRSDVNNTGPFSKMIQNLIKRIRQEPESIHRIIKIMAGVGAVPTLDFLQLIDQDSDTQSPALDLYDMLESESSFSSLAFYLIEHPVSLENYLTMYSSFSTQDHRSTLFSITVPTHIYCGSRDAIVTFSQEEMAFFSTNPSLILHHIEDGSHFMLLELANKLSQRLLVSMAHQSKRVTV